MVIIVMARPVVIVVVVVAVVAVASGGAGKEEGRDVGEGRRRRPSGHGRCAASRHRTSIARGLARRRGRRTSSSPVAVVVVVVVIVVVVVAQCAVTVARKDGREVGEEEEKEIGIEVGGWSDSGKCIKIKTLVIAARI
ncbi:hypothetical protein OsJ_20970 [Oryza sativa Japonica Group]|uniref:Uncharacterized protein n=1 Tax=Oryza sativa subsp. japonica TaxID=39947 RepID=B9FSR2_ORYSJ|nr:hypothetical protein OsJ_20970 [Oryza sativa Japonica Group]